MKKLVKEYTFDPANKRIYIGDQFRKKHSIQTESFLLITNLNTGDMIYIFNEADLGGVYIHNYLTLDYDTAAMSSSDKLQIFVDVTPVMHLRDDDSDRLLGGDPNAPIYVTSEDANHHLKAMVKELKKMNMHLQLITDENITNRDLID